MIAPQLKKVKNMATITLDYDAHNLQAQKALDFILSLNLFQKKEKTMQLSRFEQSMLDIEQGKVFYINGPKSYKTCSWRKIRRKILCT